MSSSARYEYPLLAEASDTANVGDPGQRMRLSTEAERALVELDGLRAERDRLAAELKALRARMAEVGELARLGLSDDPDDRRRLGELIARR